MTRRSLLFLVILVATACSAASRPPAREFGLGPRTSANELYVATLEASDLQPRKMYTVQVRIGDANGDANGDAVDGATITIDGGMPQHGHGLPTRPRVTKNHGNGTYEISGLRFNMGGWWELRLTIAGPSGTDTVTFNLDIGGAQAKSAQGWTKDEIEQIRSLSLAQLDAVPPDPTNRVAGDRRAAALGRRLFFDARLSSNGKVSCATCHMPDRDFQDGKPLAQGVGTTARRTMPIAGTAYAPFLFWDGRKDSLWSQALGPLESPVEHGGTREQYAQVIAKNYHAEYEKIFGPLPDLRQREGATEVFVNVGKSIAAYERTIQYGPSRFDRYADALAKNGRAPKDILSEDEAAGLRLFIGKANCTQCHNGPLLTNNEFHNTGVPARAEDHGRIAGATNVLKDEFNCRSRWSDAREQCAELDFMIAGAHEQERAFKVPSLRNVAERAPYMHAGQMATLDAALDHYDRAPQAPSGHSEIKPLHLTPAEVRQLAAFLGTLSGGVREVR